MAASSCSLLPFPASPPFRFACAASTSRSRALRKRTCEVRNSFGSPRLHTLHNRHNPNSFKRNHSYSKKFPSLCHCSGQVTEPAPESNSANVGTAPKEVLGSDNVSADIALLSPGLDVEQLLLNSNIVQGVNPPLPDLEIVGPPLILPEKDFPLLDIPPIQLDSSASILLEPEVFDQSISTTQSETDERVVDSQDATSSNQTTLWHQIKTIAGFAGPALGIWLSNPLMSLIDTAIVGNSSSLELAALGPGTVVCDQISFTFMFLSVATSNLIATSMAQKKPDEAAGHLSRLLFVALVCGFGMIAFSHFCAGSVISAFVGSNKGIIPAACVYATIRGLAWPAILVTSVAQSASLGLQNAWDPLWVLLVSSIVNLLGDIILCPILKMGIAGAAWATAVSQYVGCFLMLYALHKRKSIPLSVAIPSPKDLILFVNLAAPILLTMLGKTGFYTLLTYVATSLGTIPLAAHQVMIGLFSVCAVFGEPLSQTAQSFLPELILGKDKNLINARSLVKSLVTLGAIVGSFVASCAFLVSWCFPIIFTKDSLVIYEMQKISFPLFLSLMLAPIVLSIEGSLLAGRDLNFLAKSILLSWFVCSSSVLVCKIFNLGVVGNWWIIVAFQFVRLFQGLLRLMSSRSILTQNNVALTLADFA